MPDKVLKTIKPRKYQEEIYNTCKEKNCLVVLPTGIGKTLIALMLCINRQKAVPGSKCLFLAPTRPLAEQHLSYFKKHLPELFAHMELFTGKINAENRKKLWERADIVFSTPQCIGNDLKNEFYDLSEASLLIEDECVTGDTIIKLSNGNLKKIKEIYNEFKTNSKIYVNSLAESGNEEPQKILKVYKIKNKRKILKIKTETKEIKLTENHKIILKRGRNYLWTEVKNIREGDKVAIEENKKNPKYKDKLIIDEKILIKNCALANKNLDKHLLKIIERLKKTKILPLNYSNPNLKIISRLFGFVLGDGWFTKIKEKPKILGFSGKVEDLKKIQKDLDLLNFKYPKIVSRKTNSLIKNNQDKSIYINGTTNSFNVTDSALAKLFEILKIPQGDKTTTPFLIPNWLIKSPKFIQKEFLAALMGSEGDIPKFKKNLRSPYAIRYRFNKLEILKENALEYADQIKQLFNEFGIPSTIQIKRGNIRKDGNKTIQIQITLSNSNLNFKKFLKEIGYDYNYKKMKEANKILNYLNYKEEELKKRDFFHKEIIKLRNRGFKIYNAIQIISKKFNIKPTRIWSLGYSNKANHASWLIKSYDQWSKNNKPQLNVKWEKIKNIEIETDKCDVYDLTIEKNHNYIGNGFIVHNCHRCLKNYSYTYVAQKYKEQAKNPRILGLTASPGTDKQTITKIAKNLGIESIELRTRESEDVKEYLQDLEFNVIKLEFPEEFKKITEIVKAMYFKKVEELKNRKLLFQPANKITLLELQGRIMKSIVSGNRNFNYLSGASACAQAIKLSHLSELLQTQTLHTSLEYIRTMFKQAEEKKSKAVQQIVKNPEFNQAYIKINELLAKNIEHPKLLELKSIVEQAIKENPKIKIIVFSQYRETGIIICKTLNSIPNINARVFVGQAKKTSNKGEISGLNQKEQHEVIEKFKQGEINIICATSVHPEEYIVLKKDDKIIIRKIGEFVDSFIKGNINKTISKDISNWQALTSDGKNLLFKDVTHVHKHLTQNSVVKLKLSSGFDCFVTENHSLFSFDSENRFIASMPEKNKFVALALKCPNIEKFEKIDVLKEIYENCSKEEVNRLFGTLDNLTQAKIRMLKTDLNVLSNLKNKNISITNLSKLSKKDYSTVSDCLKRLKEQEFINQKRISKNYKNISKITEKGKEYLRFLEWFFKNVSYRKGKYRFMLEETEQNLKGFNEFFNQNINVTYGKTKFPRFIEINESLARFLGFYVSEGSTRKTKSTSEVFLAARVKKMQEMMKESIENGLNLKIRQNWRGIAIDSQIAYHLIRSVFKAGIGAYNKEVPNIIFTSNSKIKWEFLRAYFLGDGYLGKDKIVLTTVSRKLVIGITLLLRMLGIKKITIFKQKNIYRINIYESLPFAKINEKNAKSGHAYFSLIPNALNSKEAFKKYSNFYSYNKKDYLKCRKSSQWEEDVCFDYIKGVEKVETPKFVYDLSVKDTENFVGGTGLFCLHNSIAEEGLDIPEVNSVIFYEPIPSAIRSIQRRGRTARLMKGNLTILLTKGTLDEIFYYASRAKEKRMYKAIESIKDDLDNGTLDLNKETKTEKQERLF